MRLSAVCYLIEMGVVDQGGLQVLTIRCANDLSESGGILPQRMSTITPTSLFQTRKNFQKLARMHRLEWSRQDGGVHKLNASVGNSTLNNKMRQALNHDWGSVFPVCGRVS